MSAALDEQPAVDAIAAVDLIVALLTPAGRGAIATLEIAGTAAPVIGEHFAPLRRATVAALSTTDQDADLPIDRIVVGYWNSQAGREQIVVARRAEDRFEVHCHGGHAAVEAIAEMLSRSGARRVNWRDRIAPRVADSLTTAARRLLADAPTLRTANILLDQHQGALSRAIADVRASIALDDMDRAAGQLKALVATASVGLHLVEPWRVVLAGPPNAGKSSLCNALLGYERSITAPLPGTTRDVVTSRTAIAGWLVEFADTAGLADSHDPLELAGVALAREQLNSADLVLWLIPSDGPSDALLLPARLANRALVVQSKCDLQVDYNNLPPSATVGLSDFGSGSGATSVDQIASFDPAFIATSARTGAGLAELLAAIARRLVPSPPASGAAVIFAPGQLGACQQALAALARGQAAEAQAALAGLCQQPAPRAASKNPT
ncbi:MAG: 50S ribosome-binding GTPase [Pirellulales bacterium]|nr:50S ribosome-binding GTPase [Pirellulales bacterium]